MKILYDHQTFSTFHFYSGISHYFYELMNQFSKDKEIEFELSLLFSNNKYLEKANFVKIRPFFKEINNKHMYKLISVINRQQSKKKLSEQTYHIFHPTYYHPYFLNFLEYKPYVLTVFDMIHEKYFKMFPNKDKTIKFKKLLIAQASKIIAISENTKKDIIEFYNIDEDRIKVIYLANSLVKPGNINTYITLPKKYLLYVGGRKVYKNFEFFIKVVSSLMKTDDELHIICAGIHPFSAIELSLFKELNVDNKIFHYNVSDEMLYYLYENAIAFVLPSLYEGFGIPILESFACGCPAVVSNTSSLPEVGGDAAAYFDPLSEASLKETLSKTIYNDDYRNTLKIKGYQQLEKFSWKKTAEETKKLYINII
ncbi:MAG: hypothetical protein A2Y62_13640 [Candidatus Fischerbacteria bacterium RBG_13_37_8]|uniref:Glycosyl transferase family 1 domain-containing protein n=1 Tax=Candidatus Fischerbacteria bacterium RBG_13_37_8 TaxID=1817863 RepID=A0A1F5V7D7_9BACT|nr:MAG: hypothetical protein A2Y62_13640 [Candidatus Fischerbacteria bacterium RBG_13_37_8]